MRGVSVAVLVWAGQGAVGVRRGLAALAALLSRVVEFQGARLGFGILGHWLRGRRVSVSRAVNRTGCVGVVAGLGNPRLVYWGARSGEGCGEHAGGCVVIVVNLGDGFAGEGCRIRPAYWTRRLPGMRRTITITGSASPGTSFTRP